MPVINVSLQILPLVEEEKFSSIVDAVIQHIKASGVKHEVGPMETTMEGPMEELFELVKQAHKICIDRGAGRVAAVIKTDYKQGGVSMEKKVRKYR